MNKKIILSVSLLSVLTITSCSSNAPQYGEQDVINAFVNEAQKRIDEHNQIGIKKDIIPTSALRDDYPATYDLRSVDTNNDGVKENYDTDVKFQNPFGTCWAFGATAAAETSILTDLKQEAIKDNKNTIDLSEHQTAWFAYTPLPETHFQAGEGLVSMVNDVDKNVSLRLNSGSTQFAASSLWASGIGVVQEPDFNTATGTISQLNYHGKNKIIMERDKGYNCYSKEDDWSVDESLRFKQTYMLENSIYLPNSVYFKEDGTMDIDYADLASKAYKEQLMKGRALAISFTADNFRPGLETRAAKYINTETWAHYTYEKVSPNHTVCVVGWDDNYSRTNFLSKVQVTVNGVPAYDKDGNPIMKSVNQPPKDGAWIVKNSWGSINSISDGLNRNEWGYEGSGYFYLSYYDISLSSVEAFDFDVTGSIKNDLGEYEIEEFDYMPCEDPHNIETNFPIAEGNVFTAEETETIKYISCVSTENNENMAFSFYKVNGNDVDKDHPITNFTKQFDNKGIHVIKLDNPISVTKGDKIAVAVIQNSGDKYFLSVGSEFNQKAYLNKLCNDEYYGVGVVNKRESFVILENQIFDFADIKQKVESLDGPTSYITYDNFPIKLYTSI